MNKSFLIISTFALLSVGILFAEDKPTNSESKSSLVLQQENIKKLVNALDGKLFQLANKLKEKEPENAALLLTAYKKLKESLVTTRINENIDLLKKQELQKSFDAQRKILDYLFNVMSALTDEDVSVKEEIKKLEKLRKKIKRLIREEKKLIRESTKIENKEKATKDLSDEIEKLENVIKKSESILDKTVKNRMKGVQSLTDVAKGLEKIRNKVSKIHSKIEGSPISNKKEKDDGLIKEKESPKKKDNTSEPGAEELKSAFKSLKKAESNIVNGKPFASEEDQKKSIASLKKALSKLKKEKNRIASLPIDYADKLAEIQDKSLEDMKKISGNKKPEDKKEDPEEGDNKKGESSGKEKGKKGQSKGESKKGEKKSGEGKKSSGEGEKSSGKGEKKSGEGQSKEGGKSKPGQSKPQTPMEKTEKYMQEASKNLRKKNISKAKNEQEKALKELQKIKEEIDKTLAQLRDEEKEEKLAKLESRFIEILNRQKILLSNTQKLKKLKEGSGWTRLENIKVQELSIEEIDIKELLVKTEDLLLEDASTVVFPDVVALLKEDMIEVAVFLKAGNVDSLTIVLVEETIKTLNELIDALQKAQQELEKEKESKSGNSKGGKGGNTQLVSKSSELKLLCKMQLRVNRMTSFFNKNKLADKSRRKKEVKRMYKKQKHVLNITIKMNERR